MFSMENGRDRKKTIEIRRTSVETQSKWRRNPTETSSKTQSKTLSSIHRNTVEKAIENLPNQNFVVHHLNSHPIGIDPKEVNERWMQGLCLKHARNETRTMEYAP